MTQTDVITSYFDGTHPETGVVRAGRKVAAPTLKLVTDNRTNIDVSNQFTVFQLAGQVEGPAIVESARVEPKVAGSPAEPDVLVALEMLSFHIGDDANIDPQARATLRLNFGKDENSTDKRFDAVFWSIAAGLQLYNEAKNRKPDCKEFKSDFHKAFANRPIEIPGGLGRLSFEVVKHKEAPWWKRIFTFLRSGAGEGLVSALGFPAITYQAIGVLDELLNKLSDSEPEILFKSLPMRLALSQYARHEFTGGSARVRIGALTPGFCVMARGRDYDTITKADVIYYPTYGKLIPQGVSDADLIADNYLDPLKDVTYVVFRVGMKSTKLDPAFNYAS